MFAATHRIIVEEKVRNAGERLSHSQTKPQAHRASNLGKGRNKPSLDFLGATYIQRGKYKKQAYRVSKITHFQDAVAATVHWLNHR